MQTLVLHTTALASWQALLSEAQQVSAIHLNETLESYLVFLLMRFSAQPHLAGSVLGLDFLQSLQRTEGYRQGYDQQMQLKEVGDKCLLLAGLFPGRAIKKRVKLSYFVKLGQSAYSTLSHSFAAQEALFLDLCGEFTKLMDVLQAVRSGSTTAVDLLQAWELWHETGSKLSWQRLQAVTKALPITGENLGSSKSVH